MTRHSMLQGTRAFAALWFGQLISGVGSSLSGFAFGVWVFQRTGSAAQFAMTTFFYVLPFALLVSVAGAIVDRSDRRSIMILADSGQALITAVIGLLLLSGNLAVEHIYIAAVLSSALSAFQGPAYGASVSLIVPKEHLARAAGMGQFSNAVNRILAPLLAGFLVVTIGLEGVVLIDLLTFGVAIATYLIVRIPRPASTFEAERVKGNFWRELLFGWRYIAARPGLFGFVMIGAWRNFFVGVGTVLTVPMVLSFAGADAVGVVLAISAAGLLIGGSVMSLWGGPKRRMKGCLGFLALEGVGMIVAGWLPNILLVAAGRCVSNFGLAGGASTATAIEQSKIAPDVQGRVFGAVGTLALLFEALAYAAAGLLADRVFNSSLIEGGALIGALHAVIGVGAGRGMGLVNIVMGVCVVVMAVIGYALPRIRLIEEELPDAIPS